MDSYAMRSVSLAFLLSHTLISLTLTTAQTCSNTDNFTTDSTYGKNRNLILSYLLSNVTENGSGFYNLTIGQDSDKVYALVLCRGDVSAETCYNCVNFTTQDIIQNCPNQKEAFSYGKVDPLYATRVNFVDFVPCVVRYSNRFIFSRMEISPQQVLFNVGNVSSDWVQFDDVWNSLTDSIVTRAAAGSSRLKFATEEANFTEFRKIYALGQCTPDLSQSECGECLQGAVDKFKSCCHGKQGGPVLRPSCIFRFDLYLFYELTAEVPPPASPPYVADHPPPPSTNTASTKDNRSSTSRIVVIVVVPTFILLTLTSLTCGYFQMMKRKNHVQNEDANKDVKSLRFDLNTIRAATNDFSDDKKLGQGGFGSVHKGRLLDGQEIAVKRLEQCSAQGELEFNNEIVLMARLQHRNLVRLLGFCLEGRERLVIYEFVANASLDLFIFDPIKRLLLDWEKRYKIISGIARGILYLHEESQLKIIHRDLKASNVLLDGEMNPKISDFGMAKLFGVDQSKSNTRRIVGTYGYMAPEYANNGIISIKTDVFSFGVLILEIVSGKKNGFIGNSGNVEHLISHAWKLWKAGKALNLMDPILKGSSRSEIMRCIHIALLCVQKSVAKRPTMASVVLMLSSYSFNLSSPSQPAFLMDGSIELTTPLLEHISGVTELDQSSSHPVNLSVNEVSITELFPR